MGVELWWLFAAAVAYLVVYSHGAWSPALLSTHCRWVCTLRRGPTTAVWVLPIPVAMRFSTSTLASIADLLAFRYGGRGTGFVVTVFMLIGILPYISLQIRAVTESVQVLSKQVPPVVLALVFCIMITVFAILFGARHLSPREKHHGLVAAIAFESAIKLLALLVAGVVVITQVFDSPAAMGEWINTNESMVNDLYVPANTGLWTTLLFLAFCAAFLLPRQYHMTFVENQNPKHLRTAYWLFPLYLLLLNLPVIPILFAGRYLQLNIAPDFYVLGMTLSIGKQWLAVLVFLGGLSAASAMMIVTSLALSYMCLNHLVLPASLSGNQPTDFYRRLLWSKRIIIALIIAAGYGFYIVIELNEGLASLGLISFVAAAQLLPGVVGVLFWTRATQTGFLAGLIGGAVVWFSLLILPLLNPDVILIQMIPIDTDIWTLSTFCTLTTNSILFVIGSLLSKPSLDEVTASEAAIEQTSFALSAPYTARSARPYLYSMQQLLGTKMANQEMARALEETGLDLDETRPPELRVLHERLERNMTGLIGPTLARSIVRHNRRTADSNPSSQDTRLLEMHLEASREQMRGMTKQLDDLRRYLRDVLHQLPLGACSISADGNIYLWNSAMQSLTGIEQRVAQGSTIASLPEPWNHLLDEFAESTENHRFSCPVNKGNKHASVNLHKADIGTPANTDLAFAGQVILMEDRTDFDTLEAELAHSERLASVGRLAAGVAHEIGNPLTGIASIAQNMAHDAAETLAKSDHAEVGEQASDILDQVNRIDSQPVFIDQCVKEALQLVQLSSDVKSIPFKVSMPEQISVNGDANQLVQVFVNLINNACDASPAKATVSIAGYVQDNNINIAIEDTGPGISPTMRERVFEPFYTTKSVGSGTGLGLSLVYSIVDRHNGRIRIDDQYNAGTRMVVSLPITNANPMADAEPGSVAVRGSEDSQS